MTFNTGDMLRVKDTENVRIYGASDAVGVTFTLDEGDAQRLNSNSSICPMDNKYCANFRAGDFEIVYTSQKLEKGSMTTLNPVAETILPAGDQKLIQAGYLSSDLQLTTKAKTALEMIAFKANKQKLIALANAELGAEIK